MSAVRDRGMQWHSLGYLDPFPNFWPAFPAELFSMSDLP